MMVTPRVMLYGYGWLDTAVHEYVHYLVTVRTRNRAPVCLQEGLAKLFEARWRTDTPPPLEDAVAALLQRAIVDDNLVTLDEMQPSIAMLPSQERATLAYAEVETMLAFLLDQRGDAGLTALIDRVTDGERAEIALGLAWGGEFDEFFQAWKEHTRRATAKSQGGSLTPRQFAEHNAIFLGRNNCLSPILSNEIENSISIITTVSQHARKIKAFQQSDGLGSIPSLPTGQQQA
jgi:hypothetical protein